MEEGAGVRDLLVLAVGMPAPAGALHAERLAAFLDVRHDEDLGMAGEVVLQRLHDVQRPEATGEGDVLLGRHAHVAEHQDAMARPGAFDLGKHRVVHRPREIGADHLGAKFTLDRTDRELHLPYDYAKWISTHASPRLQTIERASLSRCGASSTSIPNSRSRSTRPPKRSARFWASSV